jgi:hypothetical protein
MNPQIDDYLNRPRRYFSIDGAAELGLGFTMLGIGLFAYLQLSSPPNSLWNQLSTWVVILGLICIIGRFGPNVIKRYVTYPRTGYVEYREDRRKSLIAITGSLLGATVATVVLMYAARWSTSSLAAALIGSWVAASYFSVFARRVRWKWFLALAQIAGVAVIAALPPTAFESSVDPSRLTGPFLGSAIARYCLLCVYFGTTLLVSGGITLGLYLHRTQPHTLETM